MAQETTSLTGRQERAARLVAEGMLTESEIVARLGIGRRTLARWKTQEPFRARVQEIRAAVREQILREAIADPVLRVGAVQDRWRRLQQIIAARAVSEEMQTVPGGQTGLLTRTLKIVGTGPHAQMVEEYSVDTGLLAELRAHEQQAAKELGQWTDRQQLVGRDGESLPALVITIVDQRSPGLDRALPGSG